VQAVAMNNVRTARTAMTNLDLITEHILLWGLGGG
jgi:hypothetical protein